VTRPVRCPHCRAIWRGWETMLVVVVGYSGSTPVCEQSGVGRVCSECDRWWTFVPPPFPQAAPSKGSKRPKRPSRKRRIKQPIKQRRN
jgi:hypothetical protein